MNKRFLLLLAGWCLLLLPVAARAEEPWGEINAEPNPCHIDHGAKECTTFLHWHTRGVEKAKVFVTSVGRKESREHVFSDSRECDGDHCRAPWITHHTTYTFQLFDYTRGDRGRMLASVVVTGER